MHLESLLVDNLMTLANSNLYVVIDEIDITWPLYTHIVGPDKDGNETKTEWTRGDKPGDQIIAHVAIAAASCRHNSVLLRLDTTADAVVPLLEPRQFQNITVLVVTRQIQSRLL